MSRLRKAGDRRMNVQPPAAPRPKTTATVPTPVLSPDLFTQPRDHRVSRRSSVLTDGAWAEVLLAFPTVHDLAAELPAAPAGRSRVLLLWAKCFAWAVGGGAEVEAWCAYRWNWPLLLAHYEHVTGDKLDEPPLTASVVDKYWRQAFAGHSELNNDLERRFRELTRDVAHRLGAMLPGVRWDPLHPDRRHIPGGDGTFSKARSGVQELTYRDLKGQLHTVVFGSRADKGRPKISETGHHTKGKAGGIRALNFVSFAVRVNDQPHSRLVLALDYSAVEAEIIVARRLVAQLADTYRDGMHGVVYDGACAGKDVGNLSYQNGHAAYVREAAQGTPDLDDLHPDPDVASLQRNYRKHHDARKEGARAASYEPRDAVGNAEFKRAQAHLKANLEKFNATLPAGQRLRVAKGHVVLDCLKVNTGLDNPALRHRHQRPDGSTCEHILATAGGALHTYQPSRFGPDWHLGPPVPLTKVERHPNETGMSFTLTCEIPCGDGTTTCVLRTNPTDRHRLLDFLRVLPPGNDAFEALYKSVRNDNESLNDYLKRGRFRNRATADAITMQRLEMLCAVLSGNARTWDEHGPK